MLESDEDSVALRGVILLMTWPLDVLWAVARGLALAGRWVWNRRMR